MSHYCVNSLLDRGQKMPTFMKWERMEKYGKHWETIFRILEMSALPLPGEIAGSNRRDRSPPSADLKI